MANAWDAGWNFARDPINLLGGEEAKVAAEKQLAAQQEALKQSQAANAVARGNIQAQTNAGIGEIQQGGDIARGDLTASQQQASGQLSSGYQQAQDRLASGNQNGQAALAPVTGLQRYETGATQAVKSGSINPYDVTGQNYGLEGRLAQGDSLYNRAGQAAQMENDPGYQFRLQQGEQAINRSAAAQGGRLGGATLKALAGYNSNMAAQEYGAANDRQMGRNAQQAGILGQQYGAAGNVDQLRQGAQFNQAGRTDQAGQQGIQNQLQSGLAAQQNQMGLAQMGYGAQGQLAQMANQYGQQGAELAAREGTGQSGLSSAYGQNMGNIAFGQGQAVAGMFSNQANTETALATGQAQAAQNYAQYPGMVEQSQSNNKQESAKAAGSILGSIFCDEELKTRIFDGKEDVIEILDSLSPYSFEYHDKKFGRDRYLGIIAQDLERSTLGKSIVINTELGKAIDYQKATMALLGIVAHLHAEIEELKKARS